MRSFLMFDSKCLRQIKRAVRVNLPLTIIPDRLTRLVRVRITAKGASRARNTDRFHRFDPGRLAQCSPAACRAVDPRPLGLVIHRGESLAAND